MKFKQKEILQQLNQLGRSRTNPESDVEGLCEGSLYLCKESHGAGDAVEGQDTCALIHVHPDLAGLRNL